MKSCRQCGAPSALDACAYCGSPLLEAEELSVGEPTALKCPRCGDSTRLHATPVAGVPVDACPECSGLWLESSHLAQLLKPERVGGTPQDGGDSAAAPGDVRYLRCPECDQFMARQNHFRVSGVIVDTCAKHGIWLDAGELQALQRFMADGGEQRAQRAVAEHETRRAKAAVDHANFVAAMRRLGGGLSG